MFSIVIHEILLNHISNSKLRKCHSHPKLNRKNSKFFYLLRSKIRKELFKLEGLTLKLRGKSAEEKKSRKLYEYNKRGANQA